MQVQCHLLHVQRLHIMTEESCRASASAALKEESGLSAEQHDHQRRFGGSMDVMQLHMKRRAQLHLHKLLWWRTEHAPTVLGRLAAS